MYVTSIQCHAAGGANWSEALLIMSFDIQSHRAQLILTALGASVFTASALSAYQQYARQQKRKSLDEEIRRSLRDGQKGKQRHTRNEDDDDGIQLPGATHQQGLPLEYDEELVREQLARNYAFFGDEGMERIRKSSVVVVGCGGVGSWAAVMLARSYVNYPCYLAML